MARILEHWRTLVATIFSVALIGAVFFLARGVESPQSAHASAESDLLQAIASKDTDGDGLPDWEESLYGTDPNKVDSFNLGMPDGQAVAKGLIVPKAVAHYDVATTSAPDTTTDPSLPPPPAEGTLTSQFAQTLVSVYTAARDANGDDLSDDDLNAITQQALQTFSASIKPSPDFKTAKDITVAGSGTDALRTYAVTVDAILKKNAPPTPRSEILYLQDAVQKNDDSALTNIVAIAKAYRESAVGASQITVPAELADEHLRLVNALMRLSELTTDFAQVQVDPLATMLALQQYPDAMLGLAKTFIDVGAVYKKSGVTLTDGEAGADVVNMISNVAKEQAAAKQP